MKKIKRKNNSLKVIPRVGEILKQPILGSGKIKRRIKIKSSLKRKKKYKKLFQQSKRLYITPKSEKIKNPLRFDSLAAKIIFEHWNSLGHPFVKHRLEKNKTTTVALDHLNKILSKKKYNKLSIINSINACHKLFNSGGFKYRIYYNKNKISLRDFLRYSNERWTMIRKMDVPRSWFKECHKNNSISLLAIYSYIPKDENPFVSEQIRAIWRKYEGYKNNEVDMKIYVDISKKLCKFCSKNDLEKSTIIDIIGNMLNEWKTYKPKHIGFIKNDIFWNDTLPKEVVRYGIKDKLGDFK